MPFTLTLPKLSPTMVDGKVVKWYKKVGDHVNSGDLLMEVATDKAIVEYNALDEGFLRQILVNTGQSAKVNQPIAVFTESTDESIEGYIPEGIDLSEPVEEPEKAEESSEIKEVIPSRSASQSRGKALQEAMFAPEPPIEHYRFPFTKGGSSEVYASPLAKKIAKDKGLDLSTVKGSGPRGRVVSGDVNLAGPHQRTSFGTTQEPTIAPGTYEEIPLTPLRKVIAERLQQAKTFIPHIYVRQEINPEALIALREQLKSASIQVTFNDLMIRAAALSLKEHPEINSGFYTEHQTILRFKTIDISVAVTLDGGVITPIIRHADYKSVGEISLEMRELAKRAKEQKLEAHEYKGGSFTISNMGMLGISDFCAVVNPPQAAILAIGGIEECVRLRENEPYMGKRLQLVLSADHRVIDGMDAARFLKTLQKYLENPALLLVS